MPPEPRPGLVIRYAFLWAREARRGALEAEKERPCAIVVAARNQQGMIRTIVAPVTHSPPLKDEADASLETPPDVCRRLGFDGGRHWVRLDELNRFIWPGYDLRPRADEPGRWDYGMLPGDFYARMKARILQLDRERKNRVVTRD